METFTITVVESDATPIADARVSVVNTSEQLVASGVTDSSGEVEFEVEPGTYRIEIDKSKAAFVDTTFEVPDTDGVTPATLEIEGTVLAISSSAVVSRVRLFGHVVGSNGAPASDVGVMIERVGGRWSSGTPADTGNAVANVLAAGARAEARTDVDGFWEIDVVAGCRYLVQIPSARYREVVRIPSGITVLNIRDARPDPGAGGEVGVSSDHHGASQEKG